MKRCDPEFAKIIDGVRYRYILAGKRPPTDAYITKIIANKIKKENILKNEFIPL